MAAEDRCSPYDSDDYTYPQSVEAQIVINDFGGLVYGPYTHTYFDNSGETDIEHIVARSAAHDSGPCAATVATRTAFAQDLLNLSLAAPSLNRHEKVAKDAATGYPSRISVGSQIVVRVRKEYDLTIDRREADALDTVIAGCDSFDLVHVPGGPSGDALDLYDDNDNGRITCSEARNHNIAPVHRGHPAYEHMTDGDGDGVVCE